MDSLDLIERVLRVYQSCKGPEQLFVASKYADLTMKKLLKDKNINILQFAQFDRLALSSKIREIKRSLICQN